MQGQDSIGEILMYKKFFQVVFHFFHLKLEIFILRIG